ncbi:MAG: hypothetical protein CVU05_16165 [Bacteroidetes bacterium HGW-Bacteroidetes-21]|jgi:hypothetical protein|nr:MAG: hypothetical protein CVU05_16165 [Bacteroidetes bacterium HGW-Bacteroidetes-21]
MERGSTALSLGENWDKTVTARHRETPYRDDEQSECLPVTGWIVVEFFTTSPQAKACLPSSGALWHKVLQNLLMEESK